jgi:hypothetical protein
MVYENKKWVFHDEAKKVLEKITKKLKIPSVVGKYREGKSFLANFIIEEKKGFELGHQVIGNTKGIWM